jgi:hypothetical protein
VAPKFLTVYSVMESRNKDSLLLLLLLLPVLRCYINAKSEHQEEEE